MSGRQLDVMGTIEILYDELAAVILLRLGQEQGYREVGPDPQARQPVPPHGIVDMDAEMMAAGGRLAVEEWRQDLLRDRG